MQVPSAQTEDVSSPTDCHAEIRADAVMVTSIMTRNSWNIEKQAEELQSTQACRCHNKQQVPGMNFESYWALIGDCGSRAGRNVLVKTSSKDA